MAPILGRLVNIVWFLISWFLLVGVVCAALAGFYLYHHADDRLKAHVVSVLQTQYPDVNVTVQSARLIERRGFEITGLTFSEEDSENPLAQLAKVDRVLIRCNPKLEDLLRREVAVTEVVFRNPVIRGSRRPDGSWSLEPLLKLPKLSDAPPPRARIENGVIEVVDTTTQPSRLLIFRNFNATLTPQPGVSTGKCPPGEFVASFTSDYAHQVNFSGSINPCHKRWQLSGETRGLTISPSLFQSLPSELANSMSAVAGLQTQMELSFSASHDLNREVPTQFQLQGRATRGRIDDPRLPSPITGLSAQLLWNNTGITVKEVKGRLGAAALELQYARDQVRETLIGNVRGMQVDANTAQGWTPRLQALWRSVQPEGNLSTAFSLARATRPGSEWKTDLKADCHHMAFLWNKIPYPLRNQTGRINYQSGVLSVDLRSKDPAQPVQLQAEVTRPGADWTGWAMATAHTPLKIDDNLIGATTPATQRVLNEFNLRGEIHGTYRVERDRPSDRPYSTMSLQLSHGEVQHAKFPYPIRHLTGRVQRRGDQWDFLDFVGHNDNGVVTCDGQLGPTATSRQLRLHFVGTSIPLESELYEALPPATQLVWDQLQPQGVLDHLNATYRWDTRTQEKDLEVTLQNHPHRSRDQGQPLSIHAQCFPYTIDELVGTIRYRNGEVRMERLRGRNGDLTVSTNGSARMVDDQWEISFDQLSADRVEPKSDLLHALPGSIKHFIQGVQFVGPVAVQGHVTLAGKVDSDAKPRTTWDIELDLENGSMVLTWPITQIAGQVHLRGGSHQDSFESVGELTCDSAMWRGAQLTNIRGPLWLDGDRVLVGQWAKPPSASTLTKPSLVGELFGGSFELDAQLLNRHFDLQTRLANVEVGQIVRDIGRRPYNVRGRLSGGIALSGEPNGVHTLRGTGGVTIQDTDLYELPVMLSLLNTLSTGSTDNTAFTSSDMAFRIKGDRVYFDQLDLKGPALTLKGVGDAGFDRDLNLDFYSIVGREESYIPAVRSLLGLASRRFMRVHVAGTMDNPQMTREMLPGINQTLQQLFPEVADSGQQSRQR